MGWGHKVGRYGEAISSHYDQAQDNYLLYETTSEFESNNKRWPLTAWRIKPHLRLIDRHALPPGPWVKEHSLLKQLSCFSCGCQCYSHMRLNAGGGKVYAHIWGKAMDSADVGIYRLVEA